MDKGKYTYESLAKKYDNFTAPSFAVELDGQLLSSNNVHIPSLEVEQNADGTAGGCSFVVEGLYDYATSQWRNQILDLVRPGARLSVKGGYQEKKLLFYGYVDDYTMEFSSENPPRISVTGLDGLGFLMSHREPFYGGANKAKAVVEGIFHKSLAAGFAKSMTVAVLEDFTVPLVKEQVDDWKFLTVLAERFGVTLAALAGELIFDDLEGYDKPVLKLTLGKGLESFQKRVSLAHQVGQVEIWGRDVNQLPIKGVANDVSAGGGRWAAEWVSDLRSAVLREYSEFARTQTECERLAQNRLDGIAMEFVSGSGQCIGLPELCAGRYLEVDGGDDQANGTYFLTQVRHLFSLEGYRTTFSFEGAKL